MSKRVTKVWRTTQTPKVNAKHTGRGMLMNFTLSSNRDVVRGDWVTAAQDIIFEPRNKTERRIVVAEGTVGQVWERTPDRWGLIVKFWSRPNDELEVALKEVRVAFRYVKGRRASEEQSNAISV